VRRETILTAVVFLVVGFLAGYITDAQLNWNARQRAAMTTGPSPEMPGGGGPSSPATGGAMHRGLPEGHPPIDSGAVIKAVQEQAAQNPQDPQPLLKLANFLYDQRQYQQSIEWYQKALQLDPKNVNARTDMATAYFYTGQPQEALKEYRKSLAIDPSHGPTMFNMIVVNLEGSHDLAAAQQAWERLHKVNPNYPGLDSMKQRLDAARASGGAAPR
jgi:cytochrome c-type biogenesis protein CcmH/NrfG